MVKVSDEDLGHLYPGEAADAVATRWIAGGVSLVAVTQGGDGVQAWGRFGTVRVPAAPVAVVDTVGAGDSFLAGLLTALDERAAATPAGLAALTTADAADALRLAVAAAAVTCSRRGADLPRRDVLPR
jgi:fructokinase